MHYKDGTEAKIGDVVKGTGYHVKERNVPKVIVGQVVGLAPGSASCNIQVAHLVTVPLPNGFPPHDFYVSKGIVSQDGKFGVVVDREYGQCDAFELVHRAAMLLAIMVSLLIFASDARAQQAAAPQVGPLTAIYSDQPASTPAVESGGFGAAAPACARCERTSVVVGTIARQKFVHAPIRKSFRAFRTARVAKRVAQFLCHPFRPRLRRG